MPILSKEPDVFPNDLLDRKVVTDDSRKWHVLYTKSRQDKVLARRLSTMNLSFCCLQVPKVNRMPSGKVRTSYLPLFPNYVFLFGNEHDRYRAVCTDCVNHVLDVDDSERLQFDLRRIHQAIQSGREVSAVPMLQQGQPVRIISGPLSGHEGLVFRKQGKSRLVLSMTFIRQSAEVEIDDSAIEPL